VKSPFYSREVDLVEIFAFETNMQVVSQCNSHDHEATEGFRTRRLHRELYEHEAQFAS
jgi:hypothetical protein